MNLSLAVNAEKRQIIISDGKKERLVRGGASQFICLLILSDQDGYTFCDEVHELPAWRTMMLSSVGKQVARHIKNLSNEGFDIVEYLKKTDGWKLKPKLYSSLSIDEKNKAESMLTSFNWSQWRRFSDVDTYDVSAWTLQNTEALLQMTTGHVELAYGTLKAGYVHANNNDLLSISNILATRIGLRLSTPHLPVDPENQENLSYFEQAVFARRLAANAVSASSDQWQAFTLELEELLPQLAVRGNLTTQAVVLNALALLHKRLQNWGQALAFVEEAAPLAVFSGDVVLIQNVIFNFGNLLSEMARLEQYNIPADQYLRLLEMDLKIRHTLGIGKDSAQAELLLAYLNFESGNLDEATQYLRKSKDIISLSTANADLALYNRIDGLIEIQMCQQTGDSLDAGLSKLDSAVSIFTKIGNHASADYVREERDRIFRE
jgi:tetratricopeptide (TPR) repeat protein